jgi:Ala-tRNA(Pro) deacylase
MAESVLDSIRRLLREAGVPFREVSHPPTFTSEESARARGEELKTGGKALLLKTDDVFRLFVLPADRKLDSQAVKRELGVRKTRFATAEELHQLTGLVPGSVPPFGPPVLPFELFVDEAIRRNERIVFNAGSLTDSIILAVSDYLAVTKPRTFAYSIPPEPLPADRGGG